MKNFKVIIAVMLICAVFICLGLVVYLNYSYMYTKSQTAQPELGRIYSLNVHGTVVFLTREEDLMLRWLGYAGVAFLVVVFIYNYYFDPFKLRRNKRE